MEERQKRTEITQENLLNRLENLIYQTSMVANISDESFEVNTSGTSLACKLYHILSDAEIEKIKALVYELNIPVDILRFNEGSQMGFSDRYRIINVRGDVFPDLSSSNLCDLLLEKAVLEHEYYGHYKSHP